MNLLLFILDDLRGDFGMDQVPDQVIPNIRRLQSRAVTFDHAHSPCPICAPGRACLFTGLSPDHHGVTSLKQKLRDKLPDLTTWPQWLRSHGFQTMRSGKIYHKGVPDCLVSRGDGDDDPHSWDQKANPAGYELHSNGLYHNATPWETHTAGTGGAIAWLRAEKGDSKQHDWSVATDVCDAIARHDDPSPAMWAAGFIRPHVPLVAPRAYFESLDNLHIPLLDDPPEATPVPTHVRDQWCGSWRLPFQERREAIRAYLACVMFADTQIGRILDQLATSGREENTLILLTADHGFHLGEHSLWFKNFLYRESTHIPLIVADPRHPHRHGSRSTSLVDQTDLFPTLIELLDLPAPDQVRDGFSFAGDITGDTPSSRDALRAQVDWGNVQGRSVRTRQFRFAEWAGVTCQRTELYDLRSDPGEFVNLLHNGRCHPQQIPLAQRLHSPT